MKISLRAVLLIAIPAAGAVFVAGALFLRDDGQARRARMRERAELERVLERGAPVPGPDPGAALQGFKGSHAAALRGAPGSDAHTSRQQLLKAGEGAVAPIRAAIYDAAEAPLFRMELIGLLGEFKLASADSVLRAVLEDRSLEERFRSVALAQLMGRPGSDTFPILRKVYEESSFGNRPLLLKAIGETGHAESVGLLLSAAKEDKDTSARLQAVDSLGGHAGDPAVLRAVEERLRHDPEENVRLAALRSMGRSSDPSVDAVLREIAEAPATSPSLRKAAQSLRERRKGP